MLLSIVSAQTGATVASQLFADLPPAVVVFFRQLLTGLVLAAGAGRRLRSVSGRALGNAVVFGAVMSGMNLCFYESVARLPLALAVTVELCGPLALSLALSRRRADVAWAGVALVGVGLIRLESLGQGGSGLGLLLAGIAGACWAMYILANRRLGQAGDGVASLAVGMLAASAFTSPFALAHGLSPAFHTDRMIRLAMIAALGALVPFCAELGALRRLRARSVALLLTLSPVVAALVARIRLGQSLEPVQVIGMALVVVTSLAVVRTTSTDDHRHAEPVDLPNEATAGSGAPAPAA